jgi:hypothetical protein
MTSREVTMQLKTPHILLALAAGVALTTVGLKSEIPAVGPEWEYTVVTAYPVDNQAVICHANPTGCRNDQVQEQNAAAKAIARLGEKGWELAP